MIKNFIPLKQHVDLLINRGLFITNKSKAETYIFNIGYFRLSAYFYPLLEIPKADHKFKKDATFTKAMDMYRFDRKLRSLLFSEIERIEIAIRSSIMNIGCDLLKDRFWITNPMFFKNSDAFNITLKLIKKELEKSKEDFISHFKSEYGNGYPPAWMIVEILPLGTICHIYTNLKDNKLKKKIAIHFGLPAPIFSSWIIPLSGLRNMCCHHCRTWNREIPINVKNPKKLTYPWINNSLIDSRRIYFRICVIQYFLFTVSPHNTFKERLLRLLNEYPTISTDAMGFPNNWYLDEIWTLFL